MTWGKLGRLFGLATTVAVIMSTIVVPGAPAQAVGFTPVNLAPLPAIHTVNVASTLGQLDVYFIDVGQGDSILIDQGTTEILIDGGNPTPGVTTFLQQHVQGPLDAVIATHMDADHIGGLTAVINSFPVTDIWTNGDTSTTQTYANFMAAVNASTATKHVAKRGDTITEGSLSLSVLNPVIPLSSTANNNCIVLNLVYGGVSFQFEADAEATTETKMLTAGLIHHADILKVGHHGSKTSSTTAFLAALQPKVAIYMAATGNQYGFPDPLVISALTNIGATIYGTDVNGTIEVSTDGTNYTVSTQNSPAPTLTSLSPNTGAQGATLPGVVINGTNLTGATAVNFSGSGITASGIAFVNDTQITANVAMNGNATVGARNVTVATPGGTSAPIASGFTVFIPGDANGDGFVNGGDIPALESILLGHSPPTAGADANLDGHISGGDIPALESILLHPQ